MLVTAGKRATARMRATEEHHTPEQHIPTPREQREALHAAGYKVCPTHRKYWDRLPDDAQQPVYGEDAAIRPLSEFWRNTSQCKACDRLIQADYRHSKAQQEGRNPRAKDEAILARLTAQREALTERIEALQAVLAVQA